MVLGSLSFAALGLLIASRVRTIEAASGLMNLVMMPMWIVSGVFFSSQRFPDVLQPVIKALPLTATIDALRANMLQGAGFAQLSWLWRGAACNAQPIFFCARLVYEKHIVFRVSEALQKVLRFQRDPFFGHYGRRFASVV
jgi:ABC-type polysaccharide/polyol phosphate export permease